MSNDATVHATFTLERTYPAPPSEVYAAWSEKDSKARWMLGDLPGDEQYELDLRVGGREVVRVPGDEGSAVVFESVFHDVIADERLVFSSTMTFAGRLGTVSMSTVTFRPEGDGTRLVVVEQGAYLDGQEDPASREAGTVAQLDALDRELSRVGV